MGEIKNTFNRRIYDAIQNVRGEIDNATYGLDALKDLIDAVQAEIDDAGYGLEAVRDLLLAVQGGTATIEGVNTAIQEILQFDRSAYSGTYTLTAAEQTIYLFEPTAPSMFNGVLIDLSGITGTREVVIEVFQKMKSGGAWVIMPDDSGTYTVADAGGHRINGFIAGFGVKIEAKQSVEGEGYANIDVDPYDSAPGI